MPVLTSGPAPSVAEVNKKECQCAKKDHSHPAEVILRDNLQGGRCWELDGAHGQVGILLAEHVRPSHITVDHVPRGIARSTTQAPRHMRVWGALDGRINHDRYDPRLFANSNVRSDGPLIPHTYQFVHLADIEYDITASWHAQTFPVDAHVQDMQLSFGVVVVEFLDNWGSSTSCIYRIRIHGEAYARSW